MRQKEHFVPMAAMVAEARSPVNGQALTVNETAGRVAKAVPSQFIQGGTYVNLTKRKLLAILSLEVVLYSFIYTPIAFVVLLAYGISAPRSAGQWATLLLIVGLPLIVWLVVNAMIARRLVLMGPFSERNWATMRFGLKLMALQAALVALTYVSGELNIAIGCLALAGIIAAAMMEPEKT